MNTIKFLLLLALFAFNTPTPSADADAALKSDLQKLQGIWEMLSGSADGQPMPEEMLKQMKRSFNGDELQVTMAGRIFFKAKITIDPSKNPKTIDYEMLEGVTKGKRQLGIYELDGDTFKSAFAKPDAPRPQDFKGDEGKTVSVWKREKK